MSHSTGVFWAKHLGKDFSAPSRRRSAHPPASQKWAAKSVLLGGDHRTTGATGVVTGLSWFNPGAARPRSFTVAACSRGFPLLYHIPSRRAFTRAPISSWSPMAASAAHLVCTHAFSPHTLRLSVRTLFCVRSLLPQPLPSTRTHRVLITAGAVRAETCPHEPIPGQTPCHEHHFLKLKHPPPPSSTYVTAKWPQYWMSPYI